MWPSPKPDLNPLPSPTTTTLDPPETGMWDAPGQWDEYCNSISRDMQTIRPDSEHSPVSKSDQKRSIPLPPRKDRRAPFPSKPKRKKVDTDDELESSTPTRSQPAPTSNVPVDPPKKEEDKEQIVAPKQAGIGGSKSQSSSHTVSTSGKVDPSTSSTATPPLHLDLDLKSRVRRRKRKRILMTLSHWFRRMILRRGLNTLLTGTLVLVFRKIEGFDPRETLIPRYILHPPELPQTVGTPGGTHSRKWSISTPKRGPLAGLDGFRYTFNGINTDPATGAPPETTPHDGTIRKRTRGLPSPMPEQTHHGPGLTVIMTPRSTAGDLTPGPSLRISAVSPPMGTARVKYDPRDLDLLSTPLDDVVREHIQTFDGKPVGIPAYDPLTNRSGFQTHIPSIGEDSPLPEVLFNRNKENGLALIEYFEKVINQPNYDQSALFPWLRSRDTAGKPSTKIGTHGWKNESDHARACVSAAVQTTRSRLCRTANPLGESGCHLCEELTGELVKPNADTKLLFDLYKAYPGFGTTDADAVHRKYTLHFKENPQTNEEMLHVCLWHYLANDCYRKYIDTRPLSSMRWCYFPVAMIDPQDREYFNNYLCSESERLEHTNVQQFSEPVAQIFHAEAVRRGLAKARDTWGLLHRQYKKQDNNPPQDKQNHLFIDMFSLMFLDADCPTRFSIRKRIGGHLRFGSFYVLTRV